MKTIGLGHFAIDTRRLVQSIMLDENKFNEAITDLWTRILLLNRVDLPVQLLLVEDILSMLRLNPVEY